MAYVLGTPSGKPSAITLTRSVRTSCVVDDDDDDVKRASWSLECQPTTKPPAMDKGKNPA